MPCADPACTSCCCGECVCWHSICIVRGVTGCSALKAQPLPVRDVSGRRNMSRRGCSVLFAPYVSASIGDYIAASSALSHGHWS